MSDHVTKQDLKETLELQTLKIQLIAGIQGAVIVFFIILLLSAAFRH